MTALLEIDILRNYSHKKMGVLGVIFEGLGLQMTSTHPAG